MNKIDMLIKTYNVLIGVCNTELETATGTLECHVITKKECYTAYVKELESLKELTLDFKSFRKELPEVGRQIIVNELGDYFIACINSSGDLKTKSAVYSKSRIQEFLWSYLPE
jgi:hypothetical protein